MATIASILLFSFALVQSVEGRGGHITSFVKTAKGPASAEVAVGDIVDDDAASPDQLKKSSAIVSSAAGNEISADQLKKIGTEIKEAFKNIEKDVNDDDDDISPEQEEKLIADFVKDLAPTPGDRDDDGPSSGDKDLDDALSPNDGDAPKSSSQTSPAPSSS